MMVNVPGAAQTFWIGAFFGCECRGVLTRMSSKTDSHDKGHVKCAINSIQCDTSEVKKTLESDKKPGLSRHLVPP
jgi:hypothetical protein